LLSSRRSSCAATSPIKESNAENSKKTEPPVWIPIAQLNNVWQKKKMIEYCNSKGMLRTDKSLRMELVQAENPSIKILTMKNDFETMKDLFSQIVNKMTNLSSIIRN
jgi:hypothetical protein